jgi:alanine racemase
MSRPTCAIIHVDALRRNLIRVRELAARSRVMAVVKADGYGHGLERVARALEDADAFGVAGIDDGMRLRAAGFSQRIVLLSGFNEQDDLVQLRQLRLDAVVHHESQLQMLEADSDRRSPLHLWLKIDSGMNRLGFAPEDAAVVHARLRALPQVAEDLPLMTHFSSSDDFDGVVTRQQMARFELACAGLAGAHSLANSAAVLGWPQTHADWVRAGGALYGMSVVPGRSAESFGLRPAMTLATRLIAIKQVRRGEAVGYGGSHVCSRDSTVGIAAIGYGDGYPRLAAPGTPVLVNGERVPLVGRVSMDLLAVDLGSQPGAQVGDPVLLWGPGLPIEEIAEAAGTISYELACGITRRVRFVEEPGFGNGESGIVKAD